MAELGYWGRTLLGVSIPSMFLATLSFILRLYVRRWLTRNLDNSDLLMTIGLLAVHASTTCVIIGKSRPVPWTVASAY